MPMNLKLRFLAVSDEQENLREAFWESYTELLGLAHS